MIGVLALASTVTGTLLNAYSQYSSYKEQKLTSKYNQAIIDANDRVNQSLIDMDIRRIREEGEGILGQQRVAMAKSGTTFSGSNVDVFMDTVRDIELDVISLELNKMVGSASAQQNKGLIQLDQAYSKSALPLQIAGSFIGGANQYLNYKSGTIAQKAAK